LQLQSESECLFPWQTHSHITKHTHSHTNRRTHTYTERERERERSGRQLPHRICSGTQCAGWGACWDLAVFLFITLGLGLSRIGGAFEALRGDDGLVRHTLPHNVAFPPQRDLLQHDTTQITYRRRPSPWWWLTSNLLVILTKGMSSHVLNSWIIWQNYSHEELNDNKFTSDWPFRFLPLTDRASLTKSSQEKRTVTLTNAFWFTHSSPRASSSIVQLYSMGSNYKNIS